MKTKKIITTSLFVLLLITTAIAKDCYGAWIVAYNTALVEYTEDEDRCKKSSWPSRCTFEAEISYSVSIEEASTVYYFCAKKN